MQNMLKKLGNLFSRKERKSTPQTEEARRQKEKEAFRYVGERFGRAITRLSER